MKIGRMNERITFQKNEIVTDQYKNRVPVWSDYFSCWAYASTYTAGEDGNVVISEEESITFQVRYCPELAAVTSTGYRILFHGAVYNIRSVDRMNYQKQELQFACRKEKR